MLSEQQLRDEIQVVRQRLTNQAKRIDEQQKVIVEYNKGISFLRTALEEFHCDYVLIIAHMSDKLTKAKKYSKNTNFATQVCLCLIIVLLMPFSLADVEQCWH